jgi:NADPH:quinone reductase
MRKFEGSAYGSLDAFALTEADAPSPADSDVRIRIEAAALGFVDGLIALGRYQIRPPLPYVPGGEIAGIVDAVGSAVDTFSVGDRVVTWQLGGGLADYVNVNFKDVDKVPAGLDAIAAAAMLVDFQTAHYALFERGQLRQGETVLVLGATGGVGSAAVQLAGQAGTYVIAAASTERKREMARHLGAAATIDSSAPDLRAQLKTAAPHGTVDVIVDPVGGEAFEAMFRSLAKEGRHLVVGFASGSIPSLPANLPLLKSAALIGVEIRHFLAAHPIEAQRARVDLFEKVASGALKWPAVTTFPLERAGEALAATMRRDKAGKVVVLINPKDSAQEVSTFV